MWKFVSDDTYPEDGDSITATRGGDSLSTEPRNEFQPSLTPQSTGQLVKTVDLELAGEDPFVADGNKVVTARGTEDGLVLRIDGKAEWTEILRDIELFLGGRKKFFEGGQVSLEWLDRLPTLDQSKQLEQLLKNEYGIELVVRRKRPQRLSVAAGGAAAVGGPSVGGNSSTGSGIPGAISAGSGAAGAAGIGTGRSSDRAGASDAFGSGERILERERSAGFNEASGDTMSTRRTKRTGVTINLFDELESVGAGGNDGRSDSGRDREMLRSEGKDGFGFSDSELGSGNGKKFASRMAKMLGDDLFYEDDANAKVFFGTLRSGQRLETPFSLIVVGDVNPGADLVAGGDILVFGGLRGTAHASAYDDDSFDRVIVALQMQPMQLRIGSVISRGSDEVVRGAEIARIENRRIIVEAFNPRALVSSGVLGKKFR